MKQRFWQHGGIHGNLMDEVNDAIDRASGTREERPVMSEKRKTLVVMKPVTLW